MVDSSVRLTQEKMRLIYTKLFYLQNKLMAFYEFFGFKVLVLGSIL